MGMDNFLYNLRSGKLKRNNDRDYGQYKDSKSRNQQRRFDHDRKNQGNNKPALPAQLTNLLGESIPIIKELLGCISENQKRMAEFDKRKIEAEERRAEAMERIVDYLKQLVNKGHRCRREKPIDIKPGLGSENLHPLKKPDDTPGGADREKVIRLIREMRKKGTSFEKIAQTLDSEGVPTLSGKGKWHGPTIRKLYQRAG
jgi:hypothetical protein